MKSFSIQFVFVVLVTSLIFPFTIHAQSNALSDKVIRCLKNGPGDPGNFQDITWHDPATPYITKVLQGTMLTPGSTVYTVACKGSGTGRVCGTGSPEYDAELFANSVGLNQATGNQVQVHFYHKDTPGAINPKFEVEGEGIINVIALVRGDTSTTGAYEFFGVELVPHIDTNITGAGALQQATFKFDPISGIDCARISWTHHDPYGVVFDSMSLEPLENVIVTIRNEAGVAIVNNPVLRNNNVTTVDGVYNYLVPPGKYLLTFQPPSGYQFSATPHANPNMAQVYDFIDDNNTRNHCTIYKPNEIIDEKENMPECRNVPLDPVSTAPSVKDPVSVLYSFEKDMEKELYTIKGKVSHPLTTITASQAITGQGGTPMQKVEIGKIESNHSGFYTLEIPLSKILPDAPIEVEFTKSSLLGIQPQALSPLQKIVGSLYDAVVKKAVAQTSGGMKLVLDPLPTYIEGYAYDEAQQVIPNATVQVRLKNGDSTYFETIADKNGYFYIAPKNLPIAPINLEFYLNFVKPGGGKIAYRIYEFTQANKYYFTKENINLLTGKKNGAIAEPQAPEKTKLDVVAVSNNDRIAAQKKSSSMGQRSSSQSDTSPTSASPITNPINQQIMLIVASLVMLGVVGAVAIVMIVKKNSSPPPMY